MEYAKEFITDFAARTKTNLEFIEQEYRNNSSKQIFEVTQLINSMLGLLVFPVEKYSKGLLKAKLTELEAKGWPHIRQSQAYQPRTTLQELARYLRNAFAHCNVTFSSNENKQLVSMCVWNINRQKAKDWEADLTIDELRAFVSRFTDSLASGA